MNEDLSYLSQNKIFAHLDRVEEWIKKGITKPIMIEIDPTNICNYNCPKCAGNRFSSRVSLSLDFMKKIIDQTSPFAKGLVFTGGGEPLCNENTIKSIIYAKKRNIDVGLVTNGSLISKENSEPLIKNCTWIRISVDADNRKDYNFIHGLNENSYESILKNIKLLVDAKIKFKSDCTIGAGYLTNQKNTSKMFSFAKKMKIIGVDYVQFRPFHFDNFNVSKEIKKCKKLENTNFKIITSQPKYDKFSYNYPQSFRDEFNTIVAADKKLYPCCFTRGIKNFELGDLNKDSFNKIWNSKRKEDILKSKLKLENCPVMCKYDKLSQILWEIKKINEKGKHLNFI